MQTLVMRILGRLYLEPRRLEGGSSKPPDVLSVSINSIDSLK